MGLGWDEREGEVDAVALGEEEEEPVAEGECDAELVAEVVSVPPSPILPAVKVPRSVAKEEAVEEAEEEAVPSGDADCEGMRLETCCSEVTPLEEEVGEDVLVLVLVAFSSKVVVARAVSAVDKVAWELGLRRDVVVAHTVLEGVEEVHAVALAVDVDVPQTLSEETAVVEGVEVPEALRVPTLGEAEVVLVGGGVLEALGEPVSLVLEKAVKQAVEVSVCAPGVEDTPLEGFGLPVDVAEPDAEAVELGEEDRLANAEAVAVLQAVPVELGVTPTAERVWGALGVAVVLRNADAVEISLPEAEAEEEELRVRPDEALLIALLLALPLSEPIGLVVAEALADREREVDMRGE